MYTEDIYYAAVILAGEESDELAGFCTAAERELTAKLREGITPEMCRESLISASALLAVSMLTGFRDGTEDAESYRAGDVEVRRRSCSDSSRQELRRQAEMIMYPYISDGGFCFMGVEG